MAFGFSPDLSFDGFMGLLRHTRRRVWYGLGLGHASLLPFGAFVICIAPLRLARWLPAHDVCTSRD
jgi:hypothetical protein